MDEICAHLSDKLAEAGTDGYAVFYEQELLDALPDNAKNRQTLEAALKLLTDGGYADVKYARGDAFCIALNKRFVLPEGEPDGQVIVNKNRVARHISPAVILLFSVIAAFSGAFLGALLGAVI